jgi:hypothetical protein
VSARFRREYHAAVKLAIIDAAFEACVVPAEGGRNPLSQCSILARSAQPVGRATAATEQSNKRALAWIEHDLAPLFTGTATAVAGPVIVHTLA